MCVSSLYADTFYQQKGYVNDFTNQMQKKSVQFLDMQLRSLEKEDDIVCIVVVVDALQNTSIEDLSQEFFVRWQIGHQSRDSGILLLVSLKEQKSFIDLGYGIPNALDAEKAREICQTIINPKIEKSIDNAVLSGVEQIFDLLGKAFGSVGVKTTRSAYTTMYMLVFLLSIPLLYLLARFAPTRFFFLSPVIGFCTGLTQSLGLAIVLAALGAVMVVICYMLKHFLPQPIQTKGKRRKRK